MTGVAVREARQPELPAVLNVLDGGGLATDAGRVRRALGRGDVLVAVPDDGECIVGALVLDGPEVGAIAVRRRWRDRGIGTALVGAAAERRGRLVAAFDAAVRPFWESLGFAVSPTGDTGRYLGVR